MRFIRQNKLFVACLAVGFLTLLITWPSIFSRPGAPPMLRFWKGEYAKLLKEIKTKELEIQEEKYYLTPQQLEQTWLNLSKAVRALTEPVRDLPEARNIISDIDKRMSSLRPPTEPSAILLSELRELLEELASVHPEKEIAQERLKEALETINRISPSILTLSELARRRNQQLSYDKLYFLKRMVFIPRYPFRISADEPFKGVRFVEVLTKVREEIAQLASGRQSEIETLFGFPDTMETPDEEFVPSYLRQLASVATAVETAIYAGVQELKDTRLYEPYVTKPRADYDDFINFYPFQFTIICSLDTLMEFLRRLEGLHGEVTEVTYIPGLQEKRVRSLKVNIGKKDGLEPYTFLSVFKNEIDREKIFKYAGTVEVRRVYEESALCEPLRAPGEELPSIEVGDSVTNYFFLVKHIKIEGLEPVLKIVGGEPGPYIPPRLKVQLLLASVSFLPTKGVIKLEEEKPYAKRRKRKRRTREPVRTY